MAPITVALAAGVAVALTIVVGLIGDFRLNIVAATALPLTGLRGAGRHRRPVWCAPPSCAAAGAKATSASSTRFY